MFYQIRQKYLIKHKKKKYKYKYRYNLSKFIVWVARIPNNKSSIEKGELKNAKPCLMCTKLLKELGFRYVAYTNNNNKIELVDLRKFNNNHLSDAQKITFNHCKY